MRYGGTDDLPTQVRFPDLIGNFDSGHPVESRMEDRLNYRLYSISGTFKTSFDLHDFPFDRQSLLLRLQNREHSREQVAYVIDTFGLQLDRAGAAADSGGDAFRDLQLWHVLAVRPFVESFSIRSTLGKPALFETSSRSEYGAFATEIVLERNVGAFIIKTLMPLFLLALVVFATLFFPATLVTERTTIPVTAILTSAVLLISISNELPGLGYTVALEYVFYVFFGLCLMAMVTAFLTETLRGRRLHGHVNVVDRLGRVVYCTVVAITVGVFWWKYGANF
jgi:branched-chain amino acid transport system substrate-binding protein